MNEYAEPLVTTLAPGLLGTFLPIFPPTILFTLHFRSDCLCTLCSLSLFLFRFRVGFARLEAVGLLPRFVPPVVFSPLFFFVP